MRGLAWTGAALAALAGGLWFAAARTLERGAETWFAETAAAGWRSGYDHLSAGGFPARLMLAVERPRLQEPLSGLGWQGAGLEAGVALWAPARPALRLQGPQLVMLGDQDLRLQAERLDAEVALRLPSGAPRAVTLTAQAAHLAPAAAEDAWTLRLAAGTAQLAGLDGPAPELRLRLEGLEPAGLDWPADIAARPEGPIARVAARLAAGLDAPPLEGGALRSLTLEALELRWGAVRLDGAGRLEIGPDGRPEGRILLQAQDWAPLLALAVAAGLVEREIAATWQQVLTTLQEASPEPDRLEVPLVFSRGRMSFGPLPLGLAPRLAPPRPPAG